MPEAREMGERRDLHLVGLPQLDSKLSRGARRWVYRGQVLLIRFRSRERHGPGEFAAQLLLLGRVFLRRDLLLGVPGLEGRDVFSFRVEDPSRDHREEVELLSQDLCDAPGMFLARRNDEPPALGSFARSLFSGSQAFPSTAGSHSLSTKSAVRKR